MNENKEEAQEEQETKASSEETTTVDELQWKEKSLRLLAELENMRKRLQKEKAEAIRFTVENTISEFLPIIDGIELALKHSKNASEEIKNWAHGFHMFVSQMKEVLHNNGIVPFHSQGNMFDPNYHEAMETEETEDHPEGTILEEFSKGYKSNQRTIRAAKVKVAKSTKPAQSQPEKEEEGE